VNILISGSCIEDYICGNNSYYSCQAPAPFFPPSCPDNCTGHGVCVNTSDCAALNAANPQGQDATKPVCDALNANYSASRNDTSLCACYPGNSGLNCAVAGGSLAALAALAGGIVALIVVLAALAAAGFAGGGAYAIASAAGGGPGFGVVNNPIFKDSGTGGENPLHNVG